MLQVPPPRDAIVDTCDKQATLQAVRKIEVARTWARVALWDSAVAECLAIAGDGFGGRADFGELMCRHSPLVSLAQAHDAVNVALASSKVAHPYLAALLAQPAIGVRPEVTAFLRVAAPLPMALAFEYILAPLRDAAYSRGFRAGEDRAPTGLNRLPNLTAAWPESEWMRDFLLHNVEWGHGEGALPRRTTMDSAQFAAGGGVASFVCKTRLTLRETACHLLRMRTSSPSTCCSLALPGASQTRDCFKLPASS